MERLKTRYLPLLLHAVPILVGLSSVLSLYASNATYVPPADLLLPLVGIALVAGALVAGARASGLAPSAAAIVSTVAVLTITTYGHAYRFFEGVSLAGVVVGRHRFLIALSLALILTAYFLARRFGSASRALAPIVLVFGVVMLLQSVGLSIRGMWANRSMFAKPNEPRILADLLGSSRREHQRDVYYIILDGYGRADVLKEIYGYDNREFLDYLEARGFFVALESNSNYIQTQPSIAASLNMEYLESPGTGRATVPPDSYLHAQIKRSAVIEQMRQAGYEIVAFETGLAGTELKNADYYLSPAYEGTTPTRLGAVTVTLSPFASQYMDTTLIGRLVEIYNYYSGNQRSLYAHSYAAHRSRVVFTLDQLPQIAKAPGSYFVFAHVLSPHPPFVFDSQGNPVNPGRPYSLADGSDYVRGRWQDEYVRGYKGQLQYLNRRLMMSIDGILENSDLTPLIVVQGDHGPGLYLDWGSPSATNLWERTSILNAYLVPPQISEKLYPSISPVNSFRVLLPAVTGADSLRLLPDRSYFSTHLDDTVLVPLAEEDLH